MGHPSPDPYVDNSTIRLAYLHVTLCIHSHLEFSINVELSLLRRDVLAIPISI